MTAKIKELWLEYKSKIILIGVIAIMCVAFLGITFLIGFVKGCQKAKADKLIEESIKYNE